jgi:hypothetical protein
VVSEDAERRRSLALYGRPSAPERPIELRAGPVVALLDGPDLRHVRLGGVELIQRVYVAVRDAAWNTIPATYTDWVREIATDRFEVRFRAHHRHEAIDVAWEGRILGTPDGRITYEMDGTCNGVFSYSKIGVNIHHDLRGAADRPYRARNGDHTWTGRLPSDIDPQRIVDGSLSGMFDPYEELAIEVVDGLEAVVALEGDLLELQDHRNWTDANFKSYGTPLALGFPFDSTDGQRIRQVLTIGHTGRPPELAVMPPTVRLGRPLGHAMPAIGLGMPSDGRPLTDGEARLVRALAPDHLRADLRLRGEGWVAPLEQAIGDARAVGCALELALHVPLEPDESLHRLAARLVATDVTVARALVYPLAEGFSALAAATPPELVARARAALRPALGSIVIAGGTDQSFADINRARPTDPAMAGLCFAISPTVHAADDASIVENLAGQAEVVRFARVMAAPRSIHVSPVTIATRFGPYPDGPAGPDDLPPAVDPRQASLLGAAWTAASIGELARAGAASATYYETAGWRGIIERESGSPMPERFPSRPGQGFPLYHPLADALSLARGPVRDLTVSDPLTLGGFAVDGPGGTTVVIANLTPDPQSVHLEGLDEGRTVLHIRVLDEGSMADATSDPMAFRNRPGTAVEVVAGAARLALGGFAVARVDLRG